MIKLPVILTGLIPRFMPVRALAVYLRILSISIPKPIRQRHLKKNRKDWGHLRAQVMQGGFVERQALLDEMRFGNVKASFNCCEALAAYNVILALHRQKRERNSFPAVLEDFERRGLVVGGFFFFGRVLSMLTPIICANCAHCFGCISSD